MYQKGLYGFIKHIDFLILDLFCLNISFVIAVFIRSGCILNPYSGNKLSYALALTVIMLVCTKLIHAYKNVLKRNVFHELLELSKLTILVFLLMFFLVAVLRNNATDKAKLILFMTAGIFFVVSFTFRMILKRIVLFRIKRTHGSLMLVVTTSNIAEKVVNTLRSNETATRTIAGLVIVDKDLTGKKIKGVPVVANVDNAADYVCRRWMDEVFINIHSEEFFPHTLVEQFETMGIVTHTRIASANALSENGHIIEKMGSYTVITSAINYASPIALIIKRLFDIIGGLIGVIGTGLLTLIVGPMIYISSPGPIFFKQDRVGKNGKKFKIYKFRTMYMDAEERKKELMEQNRVKDGMMFKIEFDERIIGTKMLENGKIKRGIGGWLRTLSIDEFPQFINILKGDMSLVGTRPPTLDEWEKYELHHRARLAIKPGLTGMWQVSGRSKITDFEEVVRLDTKYIREWSILLDMKIMLKTVFTVLKRDGSM